MKPFLLSAFLFTSFCLGTDFTIQISWDDMEGDVLGIVQYLKPGSMEEIKGYANSRSTDGNIFVPTGASDGASSFIIESAQGYQFNLWLINPFLDEDFADPESNPFTRARAKVRVLNNSTGEETALSIPDNRKGLVYHVGTINDGKFVPIEKMYRKMRLYEVNIVNALDGKPLPGVTVTIRKPGLKQPIASSMSHPDGQFSKQLEYGQYTVTFSKENFIPVMQSFSISLSGLPVQATVALAPESKKYRIVLTWGATPADLDAHLTGPKPEGGDFHIWWNQKTLIAGKNFLDRDDMHSFGPETITIYKPARGEYRYAVHNYSHRGSRNSTALSYSGAKVEVYANNTLQKSFSVTPGKAGTVWEVFKIDSDQNIVPLERYGYVSSSNRVFR